MKRSEAQKIIGCSRECSAKSGNGPKLENIASFVNYYFGCMNIAVHGAGVLFTEYNTANVAMCQVCYLLKITHSKCRHWAGVLSTEDDTQQM